MAGLNEFAMVPEGIPVENQPDKLVDVKNDEDYKKLSPGARFRDPEGKPRVKPWEVSGDEDFAAVPEGAQFVGPDKKLRTKPKSLPVGFTAETLYSMALTDVGREKALKTIYGDKVKRDANGGFYVQEDDGQVRRPGARDLASGLGVAASEAFPAIGMTGLGLAGGGAGTLVEPGGGTAAGAFGGMVLGAMAGRQANNIVLGLAGIHEPMGEQIASMGMEGLGAAGGEVAGRAAGKTIGALAKTGSVARATGNKLSNLRERLPDVLESIGVTPQRARKFLGMTHGMARQAADITERGGRVPPSVGFPESPFLKKVEEFDAVFRAQNVFGQANEAYYNQEVKRILQNSDIGVSLDELATRATKKVSSEHAGRLVLDRAQLEMQVADKALEDAALALKQQAARPIIEAGGPEKVAQLRQQAMDKLLAAQERSKAAAENVIQISLQNLRGHVDELIHLAQKGEDTGAIHRKIAAEFSLYNQGIRQRAKILYRAANAAAGDARIDTSSLASDAAVFLKTMPEALRSKYPSEIADLAKLAGEDVKAEGEAAPPGLDFGQLHHLRSWFRYGIDYSDLTPDMKAGALKHFETKINALLHDAEAPQELKTAAGMLDQADEFYRKNIPFLSDQMVQGTIDMLRSGEGANPEALANMFFDPNRTSAMRRVRGIVGENMWRTVQAAQARGMLDRSRIIGSDKLDATKFAQQVEDLSRNNLLATAFDEKTAARLTKIATDIRRLGGQLPLAAEPGDTMSSFLRRAEVAAEEVKKFADLDPLKALAQETKRIDQQYTQALRETQKARKSEPLGFLYQDSMSALAVKAADKILGSQDLIVAAAQKFGRDSDEFKALQQVYAARFFQRPFGRTGRIRAELGDEKGMTEEVQALMFPGVTRQEMLTLANNMEFLFSGGGSDVGGSMAAASRVLHPEASLPLPQLGAFAKGLMMVPGMSTAMRFTLGKTFALTMDAVSHPNFMFWLAGKLNGDAAARAEARTAVQNRLRLGGWFGAAAGQIESDRLSRTTQ